MKSEKQRLKDLLKKRITRFLEANPTIYINPENFCTKKDAYDGTSTCLLGVVLYKSARSYSDGLDDKIKEDASNILNISFNEVCKLENGFMNENHNEEVGFDEKDMFTKIGLELRAWVYDKLPERTRYCYY